MSHSSFFIAGLGSLLLIAIPPVAPAVAQQPDDSLRAEALRDFHGPDMTGKDGPLAKAGLDLLVLYHEYRAFQRREDDTFSPSVARAHIMDGHVTIDAIAATEAKQLRADLKALGLKDAAMAGCVVSGRLPIDQVPALARLESLRGVVLSRAKTQGKAFPPLPDGERSDGAQKGVDEGPSPFAPRRRPVGTRSSRRPFFRGRVRGGRNGPFLPERSRRPAPHRVVTSFPAISYHLR